MLQNLSAQWGGGQGRHRFCATAHRGPTDKNGRKRPVPVSDSATFTTLEAMDLSVAEVAFYDALANNHSARDLMGDEVLMKMARELAEKLRGNLSIDWQDKENVRTSSHDDQGAAEPISVST